VLNETTVAYDLKVRFLYLMKNLKEILNSILKWRKICKIPECILLYF